MTDPTGTVPPTPELFAWENEDGDLMVEVEMEADRDKAGQRLADERRIILTFEGRYKIKTQDCECFPTHGAQTEAEDHNGHQCFDHPNEACVVRENVDVWGFLDWGESGGRYGEATEADVAHEAERRESDGETLLIFRPVVPRVEAPGQTEAFGD